MSDATADDRSDTAGEYVLGTLDAAGHAAFEAELARDRALLAHVYAWQDRLLGLSAAVPALAPRPQLWRRIEASVGAAPAARRSAARAPWWHRLPLWQGLSALAVAMSLFLAVLLVQRGTEPQPARYLAVLQSPETGRTGWLVELQAGRSLRLVPVAEAAPVPAGRALQFWTKPEGAAGPTSLGLVKPGQAVELPLSRLPAVGEQQLFEITLEPQSGSPIGRPTGPILYVGKTVAM
ncbi:anti-sigma factor [Caldimonas sp. KR1-144]|uniref:anti-sigma factor n=1 Tax=Caldimonas sp. KR1-144 TaxID=3400911 RepID=UPI003C0F4C5B